MNDRQRGWVSFGVMVGFTLMLAATSKAKNDDKPTSTSSSSGGTAVSSSGAIADPHGGMPADVEIVPVTTATGCDKKGATAGCKLLRDFDMADTYVDMPATKAVWYGESYALGAPGDPNEPFFVNVEKMANGFGAAARSLIPENAKEKKDANDLLAATKQGRAVATSEAASFMKTAAPPGGLRNIVKTRGKSHVLSEVPNKVYLRRTGNRLLILEYSGAPLGHDKSASPATAWIAETWLLK